MHPDDFELYVQQKRAELGLSTFWRDFLLTLAAFAAIAGLVAAAPHVHSLFAH
jgi:hypothetical protein